LTFNVKFFIKCLAVIIIIDKFARKNKQKLIHTLYEINENTACSIAAKLEPRCVCPR
jgi:hypothetical protein